MTLTIKLDGNWSSFQLANSAPPLCVTDSAIAPSARIQHTDSSGHHGMHLHIDAVLTHVKFVIIVVVLVGIGLAIRWGPEGPSKIVKVTLMRPIHGNL